MRSRSIKNPGVVFTVLLAVLSGCQTAAQAPVQDRPEAIDVQAQLDGSIRYDTEDQRLAELWSAAEDARRDANDDQALDLLYQGLELSPQNSLFWSRAAEVQLDNDQALMAENMALKSNTYAGNNPVLLHRNWLIIEHARSLRGDLLGVRSARKRVQQFQYQ